MCVCVNRLLGRKIAHESQYLHISVVRRASIGIEVEESIHSPGSIKLMSGHSSSSIGGGGVGNDTIEDFWGWHWCVDTPLEKLASDVLIVIEINGTGGMKGNNIKKDGYDSKSRSHDGGNGDGDCWGIYALDKSSIVSGSTSITLHNYPIIYGNSSNGIVNNITPLNMKDSDNIGSITPLKIKNSSIFTLHFDVLLTKKSPEITLKQLMSE